MLPNLVFDADNTFDNSFQPIGRKFGNISIDYAKICQTSAQPIKIFLEPETELLDQEPTPSNSHPEPIPEKISTYSETSAKVEQSTETDIKIKTNKSKKTKKRHIVNPLPPKAESFTKAQIYEIHTSKKIPDISLCDTASTSDSNRTFGDIKLHQIFGCQRF